MTQTPPEVLDCGRTVDELSDYLTAGRIPADAHIESCPDCLNALDALERVGRLSRDLMVDDAERLPPPPQDWLNGILSAVRSELRAGRSFPIHHDDPRVSISVTEGAVRALIRETGDAVPGVYIGRTQIIGNAEIPGEPVEVDVTASIAWGLPVPETTARVRDLVYTALNQHTELKVVGVNITVEDLHGYASDKESS